METPAKESAKFLVYRMCENLNGYTSQSSVITADTGFILFGKQQVKWYTDKEVQYMIAN